VVEDMGVTDLRNIVGYNFRLGEIEAAIGLAQLDKLSGIVASRRRAAERLTAGLSGLRGLRTPVVRADCTHVYYVYPIVLDIGELGVGRARIVAALQAEGVSGLGEGYVNVHLLPMYQQRTAYGSRGFPWTADICRREVSYDRGICPVAETLHEVSFVGFEMCVHDLGDDDVDLVIQAFRKVWCQLDALA
jgi:perosamine synthetase